MTALATIKERLTKMESLHLVIDDPEAKRVLAAWQVYDREVADFTVTPKDDPRRIERRLWDESADVDYVELGRVAKVPWSRAEEIFKRLRSAHLVWPDGTISDPAARWLVAESQAATNRRFPARSRGQ